MGGPRGMEGPSKKLDRKSGIKVLKRMLSSLFRYKWLALLALCMMLLSNLLALFGPLVSGYAVDSMVGDPSGKLIWHPLYDLCRSFFDSPAVGEVLYYCVLMALLYVISALLSFGLASLMIVISQKIVSSMRKDVFHHLTTLPVRYFDGHATGDIISRISYDIDTINTSLSHDLLQICASMVTLVGSLIVMASISPMLLLVFAVTVPLSVWFTRRKTRKIQPFFRARSGKLGDLNGYAEEMLSGQRTVHAYHREADTLNRFDEKNETAVQAYYMADYHAAVIGPSVNFINNLSISLVTIFGGLFYMLTVSQGEANVWPLIAISIGNVTSFVQYSRKFAGPINEFANIMNEIQSAMAAAERVFALLDEPSEPTDREDAAVLSDVKGQVEVRDVEFSYVPEKTVLHDFSLNAPPGTVTAIVGPTGAGKTTVINLLMRFYDPQKGTVSVDGRENGSVTMESLRKAYTMVLQDTWLFCGTVHDNIAYGRDGATREDVIAVAKAARIHSFIERLPQGYDTVLSDDGINLSKGQKQLITIARAMLSDSPMLILDEATSNVDSRTEQQIQQAMLSLMKGRTCFVIAHRLSTVQNADNILVVKDGTVIEQGNHEQLLASGGFYSKLYNSQFE
ncbi:MAG: ABC transporter ATP-binding protein [Clostridia bacterium]|nr:ABC transporter ATP-binding protein [Clostridia bacterium]